MFHYFLYGLPGDVLTLHTAIVAENPVLVMLMYCVIVLWLILIFSRG